MLVGGVFVLGTLKNPSSGGSNYVIGNRTLLDEKVLMASLNDSKTSFSSPIINEN